MALRIAEEIVKVTDKLHIPLVFKGSFKKANRSRVDSFTGIGDDKALKILQKVGKTFDVPTVTDIHEVSDADKAAQYVDVLQIPAFLVRQTDLVIAAANTGNLDAMLSRCCFTRSSRRNPPQPEAYELARGARSAHQPRPVL